jgi:hypothetical protein
MKSKVEGLEEEDFDEQYDDIPEQFDDVPEDMATGLCS